MVLQPLPLASPSFIPVNRALAPSCHAIIRTNNTLCTQSLVNPHLCMPSLPQPTKRSSMQRLDRITCLLTPAVSPASTLSAFRQAHPGV